MIVIYIVNLLYYVLLIIPNDTPKTNAIKMFFNQIKHYLKLNKKVLKYEELQIEVEESIKKVKKQNYFNYFKYAYQKEKHQNYEIKKSTLRRRPKIYK